MPERRRRAPVPTPTIAEQFKESSKKELPGPRKIDINQLIPTGSTMLNCCCSDNPFGGLWKGRIATAPGPSQVGKSIVVLSTLAACAHNPLFDNYDLIYDDMEEAVGFDMTYLFGPKTEQRVIAPNYDGDEPVYSYTIQDLESNIIRRCNEEKCKPFIYVADTLDAATEEEEVQKELKNALARAKDGDQAKILEAFAANKAYVIGRMLRQVKTPIKKTGSLLILVQQERTKMGATGWQKQYTTAGGKAPYYYSTHQFRLTSQGEIKDNGIVIGNQLAASVTKNKLNGKKRECHFCVYNDMGVDDVSSCVDYLCKDHWKTVPKHPQTYIAEELDFQGSKIKIIDHIEENALENEMKKAVGVAWNQKEESIRLGRVRRF